MTGSADISGLLRRVAAQDKAAFEQLYAATSAKLLGIVLRLEGSDGPGADLERFLGSDWPQPVVFQAQRLDGAGGSVNLHPGP